MNKIILLGRLTREHEIKILDNDRMILNNSIAVSRKIKKQGETDFFNFSAFNSLAELIREYTSKGDRVLITGNMRQEKYINKDNKEVVAYKVYVDEIEFIELKRKNNILIENNHNSMSSTFDEEGE